MCAILGGNEIDWDYESGIQSMKHRGPDGFRVVRDNNFTLAFARLAIMDLSKNGMQPMKSKDGLVTIVYNGEIYGYTSLKQDLEKKYEFFSFSDTEVILNAYLEYGDSFIDKIDGMFAIAIYDCRVMQIKLFRDRSGIKPLYYYICGSQFSFSSELKALKAACKNVQWKVDYTALYDYLFYQYIPDPKTMYKNCYKLPPAHKLVYDIKNKKVVSIDKYWKLHINTAKGKCRKKEVIHDELRSILNNSVREQLVADVPVGCFLSGGVDSSIITYESINYVPDIYTFSIGFREIEYDESRYAEIMSHKYGIKCEKKIVNNEDVSAIKSSLKSWYDEPFADTSAYPSFLVSHMAKEKVSVVLTGDGGDELFGGYNRYREYAEAIENKWTANELLVKMVSWFHLNRYLRKYIHSDFDDYFPLVTISAEKHLENFRKILGISKEYDPYWHLKKYYKKELPSLTRVRYLDYKTYLPGDILTKVDRVSMANSLEARVPFLGRKVIEFAFSLSEEDCCNKNDLKHILKETYDNVIPKQILYRQKRGFAIPPDYFSARRKNRPITCELLNRYWRELVKKDV